MNPLETHQATPPFFWRLLGLTALMGILVGCTASGSSAPGVTGDANADLSGWDVSLADSGSVGTPNPDGAGQTLPDSDLSTPDPGEFQAPCESNEDCFSGYCLDSAAGEVCSKTCDDNSSCPLGWACDALIASGGDPAFICVPIDTYICRPCETDNDCNTPGFPQTGHCIQAGPQGRFCTRKCGEDSACPDPMSCEIRQPYGAEGPTLQICVADTEELCSCTAKFVSQHATTICYKENEYGTCQGEAACLTEGPLSECSAPVPSFETCNGVDDDCDGEVDEEASGCTLYYQDMDADGFGFGYGSCHCEAPDGGWVSDGGDCNEFVSSVNPGAVEACNGMDDDCDGLTDEEDALLCVPQFADLDGDGFGVEDTSGCHCLGLPGWAPESGDCDDTQSAVSPGAEEACNTVDDDCDGATDEVDAAGCVPWFLDQDDDGFGLNAEVKCLCDPTGDYVGEIPGDCDDLAESVHPGVPELCNGVDDNCNGETDEGGEGDLCPLVAHGLAGCMDGTCALVGCDLNWSDADGDPLNGCECSLSQLEAPGAIGQTCQDPMGLGTLLDDGSAGASEVTDNIAPTGDEDWYMFTALDGADPDGCDTFHVRVELVHNPQNQFAFDVFAGGCEASKEICKQVTHFSDTTHLSEVVDGAPVGECPCTDVPDTDVSSTTDGVQKCGDQTMVFRVRVYRREGFADSCAAYTLRVRNGPE